MFNRNPGTTKLTFDQFIAGLLPRIAGVSRTLMWDNLSSHFSDAAHTMIYSAGHRTQPRTAYYPQDGPIEYVFNQLEGLLRQRLYTVHNDNDLIRAVHECITALTRIQETFIHCGYVP